MKSAHERNKLVPQAVLIWNVTSHGSRETTFAFLFHLYSSMHSQSQSLHGLKQHKDLGNPVNIQTYKECSIICSSAVNSSIPPTPVLFNERYLAGPTEAPSE